MPFCLGTASNCLLSVVFLALWLFLSLVTAVLEVLAFSLISRDTSKINASSDSTVSSAKMDKL